MEQSELAERVRSHLVASAKTKPEACALVDCALLQRPLLVLAAGASGGARAVLPLHADEEFSPAELRLLRQDAARLEIGRLILAVVELDTPIVFLELVADALAGGAAADGGVGAGGVPRPGAEGAAPPAVA